MSANTTVGEMLAVNGGQPVRETLLPYGRQAIDDDDIQAVAETLRSDWLTTGPKVEEFEEAFAARAGAKHAVSFSSGTAALHGAAFAAGLGPGDEAITSPLPFAAQANWMLYRGPTPVFVDVSPETLTLDPEQVAFGINSRTRAILPVDYAGHTCALDSLLQLAERHGVVVIEAACHALGAHDGGRRIGSLSHMTGSSLLPIR